ncbi:hypothetical protein ACIGHB_29345 [Streptomyces sp. NPDC085460]|uniref:hypothetical protein n=1 Tax=Streptomyces sp. NPDC085460 TaxID=3365723 RepID=UPI0037D5F5C8
MHAKDTRPTLTDQHQQHERHYELWRWGGRLPSDRLRRARGSNVLGLLEFDTELVHALGPLAPEVQRAVALVAARRACEVSGLADMWWITPALSALEAERPLPSPFDDWDLMFRTLRANLPKEGPLVLGAIPPERPPFVPPATDGAEVVTFPSVPRVPEPINQPFFALPAVVAAAGADPLIAALDAVWHAIHTYGEHYPQLLEEIRSVYAEPAGEPDDAEAPSAGAE